MRNASAQEDIARRKDTGQTIIDSSSVVDHSSFYNLLIVSHENIESYVTLNTLNYFGFPINVEEEDFWFTSRKQFAFSKNDPYPFLVINSSQEGMPECDIAGREDILSFLFN